MPTRGPRLRRTTLPLVLLGALVPAACGSSPAHHRARTASVRTVPTVPSTTPAGTTSTSSAPPRAAGPGRPPFATGRRVLDFVDRTRTIAPAGEPPRARPITTIVRYPVPRHAHGAPPAGRFPLIVFGHGFAQTPAAYASLLRSWATAGFVVAAPIFPLENADAPGGPDEQDLANQPQDMRVVIDRLLALSRRPAGWASGLVDPRRIAVAGQSDGGETALALAEDRRYRDPRVRAAILLSGAQLPVGGRASLVAGGPPLLAVQGTADPVNPLARTVALFSAVARPKYLLALSGASHLAPYTTEQPQLSIVERASIAFLRAYFGARAGRARELAAMRRAAQHTGVASLTARP